MKKRNKNSENSKWLMASKVIDIIIYITIIGILIFWQIYPSLFKNLNIETIWISVLLLFGASWLHTIENISEVKKLFQKVDTTDIMQYNFLNNLLDEIVKKKHIIRELKIVDVSAEDFLHLFTQDKISVNNCTLLLRDFEFGFPDYNQKIVDQIQESIEKWEKLQQNGKIKNLNIIRYKTNQTNFFCIIDNEMILSGFLRDSPIRDDPNIMFVDITSRKGYNLIQQYAEEFDFLLNVASSSIQNNNGMGNVFAYLNVNNGFIKVMFMDPDKEEIKIREKIEHGDNIEEFQFPSIVKYNRERLLKNVNAIKTANNLSNDWNHVQLGKYNFQPSINCILTDDYVFVHYYGMRHCGMDVPNFVINKETDPSIYEYYSNYVEEYWKLGENYE